MAPSLTDEFNKRMVNIDPTGKISRLLALCMCKIPEYYPSLDPHSWIHVFQTPHFQSLREFYYKCVNAKPKMTCPSRCHRDVIGVIFWVFKKLPQSNIIQLAVKSTVITRGKKYWCVKSVKWLSKLQKGDRSTSSKKAIVLSVGLWKNY